MAEKTDIEDKKKPDGEGAEPNFDDVIFEGEDDAGGGQTETGGEGDDRIGEREGVAAHEGGAVETQEQKQERRRKERQDKKARDKATRDENRTLKAEIDRLAREMEALKGGVDTKVGELAQRAVANDIAAIDNRLDLLRRTYANAQAAREKAMTEGNGNEFNRMDQSMRDADAEYRNLQARKAELQKAPAREAPQEQQRVDPRIARHANAFTSDFPDYDPSGRDADSKVVQALDEAVLEEGFDPTTPEYWDELRDRVLDRIPEWGDQPAKRANGKRPGDRPRSRQTIAGGGSGGGGDSAGDGAGYKVSKERVQALKDSGKWDDPKKRARAIEAFKQWDREHAHEMRRTA